MQYVILGAGLDTFAYRQPDFAKRLRIFEVDHPATQAWKQRCMSARAVAIPANLRYVPVDFERESTSERLVDQGFDASQPAFFSWLGVVMFLTAQAIEATLRFVASLPRGSAIALSFNPPEESLEGEHLELARQSVIRCSSRGEPWLSRHTPGALRTIAAGAGFSSTYHLTPELAADRYFAGRRDGLRAPRHEQLLVAIV
jgi:methyltransferase (TIGR00027 family)